MSCKSLKFVLEVTIATLNEELQTKEAASEFSEALLGGISGFAEHVATESDGNMIGSVKIIEQSEDWE